jgi:hypothetical protein
MIVIATNNGFVHLKELLDSFCNIDMYDEKILIVDTISTDENHINFLNLTPALYANLDITITKTPYRGFDTGAYIHAYENYESELYIFLHDSIIIKNSNFVKDIKNYLEENDVVSFFCFNFVRCGDDEWKKFMKSCTGSEYYDRAIFGPMFACKKEVLSNINTKELEIPDNKNKQTAYEAIWMHLFKSINKKVFCLNEYGEESQYINKKILIRN